MICSPFLVVLERLMFQMLKEKLEGVPIVENMAPLSPLISLCPKTELSLIKWNACDPPEESIPTSTLMIVLHVLPNCTQLKIVSFEQSPTSK